MIERVIAYSVRNRTVVLLATAVLATAGVYAALDTPMDAIPDLSENQVIVFADWMGRSPKEIEDQVTYPLTLKLQGLAGIRVVRASSEFNFAMITLIFQDGVDFYFARQRVLEKLTLANTFLPAGVTPYLAPDATALGQVFWYTVEPDVNQPVDPGKLWAVNRFVIAPELNAVPGVAEVATVGGAPLEYQVDVSAEALRAYGVTLGEVHEAIARSNIAAGGRVVQKGNAEYIVRGVGWLSGTRDIEETVVSEVGGTPVRVRQLATVQLGQGFRRSVFEKNGSEVAGGVVLMRHGGNPLDVTRRVKEKIAQLQPALPPGVRVVPAYDRTRLIHGAIDTLTDVMWHEMLIAALAILLILGHVRSVFVICVTLPLSVLFSFLLMWLLRRLNIVDVQANIMSLAGLTISIGVLVDQAIVMVENATHHLKEQFGDRPVRGDTRELVLPACRVVGRPIFFSVLIMLVSFIPVFMLSGREGKLFHPLAFTKSFALLGTAMISVTVVPALIPTFLKGRLKSEEANPIVRSFIAVYKPVLTWALPRRNLVMWFFAALLLVAAGMFPIQALVGSGASEIHWRVAFLTVLFVVVGLTVLSTRGTLAQLVSFVTLVLVALWAYDLPKIGVSFMPALDEGSLLDMPVTVPRASITQAADDLKHRDGLLRGFPEVESVIGKSGRADTATDPAPLDMVETFVNFRPNEFWPKRVLRFADAERQTRAAPAALEAAGVAAPADRDNVVNTAAMKALERFDDVQRELARRRYDEAERDLGPNAAADRWRERVRQINWELFDHGTGAFTWLALDELTRPANVSLPAETLTRLREGLETGFREWVLLWPRKAGPKGDLVDDEMGRVLQVPGWSNIFTQPIINRVEMLSTGVRTDVGVKVFGPDLASIDRACKLVEAALKPIDGARDVVAAPVMGKGYLEVIIDRNRAARYGISVADVQDTIEVALGGRVVTQTVEDRNRFPVRVRYARARREDEEAVKNLLVSGPRMRSTPDESNMALPRNFAERPASPEHDAAMRGVVQVPLGLVADVRVVEGPAMIRSENARLMNYVTLNVRGRDTVGFVDEARRVVAEQVRLPEGVHLGWTGEFEHQLRAARTLRLVFPAAVLLIFVILYMTYKDLADAALMMLAVPEALAGGVFFMVLFPKVLHGWDTPPMEFSVAVWVGFIACFGMATETGIIMLVYLREAIEKRGGLTNIRSLEELREAVIEGAAHRLRPKLLTEGVAIIAIFPMVFATGTGGEILAPMALPVLGGLLISDEVVDIFLPVRFYWVRRGRWLKLQAAKNALHERETADVPVPSPLVGEG